MTTMRGSSLSVRRRIGEIVVLLIVCSPIIGMAAWRARGYQVSTSDFDDFHQTVRQGLFSGGPPTMSPEWGMFNYLPFVVVVLAPFALLPMPVACGVFVAISIAALYASVRAALKRLAPDSPKERGIVGFFSLLLIAPFLINSLLLGQWESLILALLLSAWMLFESKRPFAAGLCIAAATLIKAFPGLLLVYLVFKRSYRGLAGALLGLVVGVAVLPSLVFGIAENQRLHAEWFERVLVNNSALKELDPADGDKGMWRFNIEGLPVTLRRLLTPQMYSENTPEATINLATLPSEPVGVGRLRLSPLQWIYAALAGGTLLAMCVLIRKPLARISRERLRLEFAFVMLLSLILSPIIWGARYFALTWLACALLCQTMYRYHQAGRRATFGVVVFLVWLLTLAMWTERLRAYSVHLWAAVLLAIWTAVAATARGSIIRTVDGITDHPGGTEARRREYADAERERSDG